MNKLGFQGSCRSRNRHLCLVGPNRRGAAAGLESGLDRPTRAAASGPQTGALRGNPQVPPPGGARGLCRFEAPKPVSEPPPPGVTAPGGRPVHVQELLQGQGLVDGSALLPLQHAAPDDRGDVGERPDRSPIRRPRPPGETARSTIRATGSSVPIPTRPPRSTTRRCWPRPRPMAARPSTPRRRRRTGTASTSAIRMARTRPASPVPTAGSAVRGRGERWQWGGIDQASTVLSLLTPEYQKRYVQMLYHETVDNSKQWNASFCLPEGFIRWWARALERRQLRADHHAHAGRVPLRHRRQLPARGADRPRARAESAAVVRRDGRLLGRRNPDHLDRQRPGLDPAHHVRVLEQDGDGGDLQPLYDADHRFVGIDHEAVWYDPESLVQPVRVRDRFLRRAAAGDPNARFTFIECLSNIKNVNGRPVQLTKGDPNFIDYYGRPWAQNWEKWFEQGWDKPDDHTVPSDVIDLFK